LHHAGSRGRRPPWQRAALASLKGAWVQVVEFSQGTGDHRSLVSGRFARPAAVFAVALTLSAATQERDRSDRVEVARDDSPRVNPGPLAIFGGRGLGFLCLPAALAPALSALRRAVLSPGRPLVPFLDGSPSLPRGRQLSATRGGTSSPSLEGTRRASTIRT
jgi:hypothetical protein